MDERGGGGNGMNTPSRPLPLPPRTNTPTRRTDRTPIRTPKSSVTTRQPISTLPSSQYGSIEDMSRELYFEDDVLGGDFLDDSPVFRRRKPTDAERRRWSVLEKLERRYYCRIRSCYDLFEIFSGKCLLATLMLALFCSLIFFGVRVILFNVTFGSDTFDYIVVGGGASGALITRRLVDAGARVLLLEAGAERTQAAVGGVGYGTAPLTVFDIPLLWPAALQRNGFTWELENGVPNEVVVGRGLGGGAVINAMTHMRALPWDIQQWNFSRTWSWPRVLEAYISLENYNNASSPWNDKELKELLLTHSLSDTSSIPQTWSNDSHMQELQFLHSGDEKFNGSRLSVPWYRGVDGAISVSECLYTDPVGRAFIESATNAGLALLDDMNNPLSPRIGAGFYQFNIDRAVRSSSVSGMLAPIINSQPTLVTGTAASTPVVSTSPILSGSTSNTQTSAVATSPPPITTDLPGLSVALGATVRQILLNKIDAEIEDLPRLIATGVEYEQDGELRRAYLGSSVVPNSRDKGFEGRREIILAGGAILTPALLMASGVGDPAVLSKANVPTKMYMPGVGRGLADHPTVFLVLRAHSALIKRYPSTYELADQWLKYFEAVDNLSPDSRTNSSSSSKKVGVLGSSGFSAGAFLQSPWAKPESGPDIQVTVYPSAEIFNSLRRRHKLPQAERNSIVVAVSLLRPDARSKVVLKPRPTNMRGNRQRNVSSLDSLAVEIVPESSITSSWLSDSDVERLVWGLYQTRNVLSQAPLSTLAEQEIIPGANLTQSELSQYVRDTAAGSFNYVGTAPLGNTTLSVVDEELRVRGVKSLRIVDASVIPHPTTGPVQATVSAVASIAADIILQSP